MLREIILFPPFCLDPINQQVRQGDQVLLLRPKLFAVLQYLVEHAGRLVTREEILGEIWPNTYLSEAVLRGYIRDLRTVLGDTAEAPRFIETVPRRGYRFHCSHSRTTQPVIQLSSCQLSEKGREQRLALNWKREILENANSLSGPRIGTDAASPMVRQGWQR